MNNIAANAMLVNLSIKTWSARKYDRKVTAEVLSEHGAAKEAGRFTKALLPTDATAYKEALSCAGDIRTEHYKQTLAWSDEGWRLLPSANYMAYQDGLRQRRSEFERRVEAFLEDYPGLREAARATLNGMYREEDYPAVDALREKFAIEVGYMPVPSDGDFRLSLPADQIRRIEEETASRVQVAGRQAMRDAWGRLEESVRHIQERLVKPDAIFRDSLIENAREVCAVLTRLNVLQDADLEIMRSRVESELAACDPQTLRENPGFRADKAKAAADILNAMRGVYS